MHYVCLLLLMLLSEFALAQSDDDFRLIQAQSNVPTVVVWANLPNGNLERSQFEASVDEHPAKVFDIDKFGQTGEGVGYIFLVDVSKTLRSRQLVQIKRALHYWLDRMGQNDRAALITFGHDVKHELEFATDYFKLSNAIGMLAITDMETSLSHGLLEAINLGQRQQYGLPVRRAIVVLSNGIDHRMEGASIDKVFKQLQKIRVPIYSIGFASEPINDRKREGLKLLDTLARQSGGYFIYADSNHLDNAYDQQYKRITGAYRLRIDCPQCSDDQNMHELKLSWSDGQRNLSDSMQIHPAPKPNYRVSRSHGSDNDDEGWNVFIFATGLLAFLVGLVWVFRNRLA